MTDNEKTVPLRDLTTGELRELIGATVTLSIYEDAESKEPYAVSTGVLSVVTSTNDGTVGVAFADSNADAVFNSGEPVTVTFNEWWA